MFSIYVIADVEAMEVENIDALFGRASDQAGPAGAAVTARLPMPHILPPQAVAAKAAPPAAGSDEGRVKETKTVDIALPELDCDQNPCLNGGECQPNFIGLLAFLCVCKPGYFGELCELGMCRPAIVASHWYHQLNVCIIVASHWYRVITNSMCVQSWHPTGIV